MAAIDRVVVQSLAIFEGHASSAVAPSLAIQMALAGYLHHFYTGVEAIFERVSRVVDENPPQGREWHKALLNVMALEIAETRPVVINERTRAALDEYCVFRHVFRHAYSLELKWPNLKLLLENLNMARDLVEKDVRRFLGFIDALIEELEAD